MCLLLRIELMAKSYKHEGVCNVTEIIKRITDLGQYTLCGGRLGQLSWPKMPKQGGHLVHVE